MGFAGYRGRMNEAIFRVLGEPASWTDVDGPVLVIERQQDADVQLGQSTLLQRVQFLRVRRSDVADPKIDDLCAIAAIDSTFRVIADPVLQRHRVWLCEVELVDAP